MQVNERCVIAIRENKDGLLAGDLASSTQSMNPWSLITSARIDEKLIMKTPRRIKSVGSATHSRVRTSRS